MRETNALQIQEDLRQQKYVSVPWLQLQYELTYPEAKEFLRQLIFRGWVEDVPKGLRYSVRRKNLCLRKIRRDEVDGLFNDLNNDCVQALNCLEKLAGVGATFHELERAVRSDEDTEAAIKILTKHKLIYQVDDLYYLMVSRKTVRVIWSVEMEKRRTAMRRKIMDDREKDAQIKKLYDVLFED